MIRQEAEITAGFIRSIVATENAYAYFHESDSGHGQRQLQDFFDHMARIPGVLRANVYSADRRMLWSSDPSLIGQRFERNDELEQALQANLVVHSGIIDPAHLPKTEHQHLAQAQNRFVESYVPIFDTHGQQVVGVVELYKVPGELFAAIKSGVVLIWLASAIGGMFLYLTLFWIVRRAHGIIETQGEQLIESESLAVVGEMGSAVAHGLRNPLSSIRSSAELALLSPLPEQPRECAEDIVAQVDRLEGWVRQLLTYAKPAYANLESVDVNEVLRESVENFSRDLERRRIAVGWQLGENLPAVRGDAAILVQLIGSLIANAMEAMESGGEIMVSSRIARKGFVLAEIRDNGPGIAADDMSRVFKPFFTSKPKGLGLGLPLLRRVIGRLGGSVELDSSPKDGTAVRLQIPVWEQ